MVQYCRTIVEAKPNDRPMAEKWHNRGAENTAWGSPDWREAVGQDDFGRESRLENIVRKSLDKAGLVDAAKSDPELFVRRGKNEIMLIDEIQKAPELLDQIKINVDHDMSKGQYLLTGSSNLRFIKSVKDSLAGRFATIRLRTLAAGEINAAKPDFLDQVFNGEFRNTGKNFDKAALIASAFAGGYPEPLEFTQRARNNWFRDYLGDLLTKDISDITDIRKLDVLKLMMTWLLAHTSQLFSQDEMCAKIGITRETAQTYILALTSLYLFDKVPAWAKSDYDKIGKRAKYIVADTAMAASALGWNENDALFDETINGKLAESWVYHELAVQADLSGDYEISHYRDSEKREIDFIIERNDGATAAVEVNAGSSIGRGDFKHINWFAGKFKPSRFIGIVLYTGSDVLGFGDHLYAVPCANLVF